MIEPLLSIVVCTYNRATLLSRCLQSLREQTLDQEQYEVIIVDNNSTDSTWAVAQPFTTTPNFRLFLESQQGLSHARNRGWQEARGSYVAYIDDDAYASKDWCDRILLAFGAVSPPPAAVGGQILPWYESPPPDWFRDHFEIRSWGEQARFLSAGESKSGFSGSNMAVRRSLLEQYGGFSPEFGMVGGELRMGEEADLFHRLARAHLPLWYDPALQVFHWTPRRNMQPGYRFQRAFRSGEASARLYQRRLLSLQPLMIVGGEFRKLLRLLQMLWKAGRPQEPVDRVKVLGVKALESLGFSLGFLLTRPGRGKP